MGQQPSQDNFQQENVSFARKSLSEIPKHFLSQKKPNIKQLNCSFNQLSSLPDLSHALPSLIQLSLSQNKFTAFPRMLSKLTTLQKLVCPLLFKNIHFYVFMYSGH